MKSENETYEIILVRHGQTEANAKHIYGGDYDLTDEGRKQAEDAREFYQSLDPDIFTASTQNRAQETMKILANGTKCIDPMGYHQFSELGFGTADGKTADEIAKEYKNSYHDDFVAFMKECKGHSPYYKGSSMLWSIDHMIQIMKANPDEYPKGRVIIVTSETAMKCMVMNIRHGYKWHSLKELGCIDNLTGIKLIYDRKTRMLIDMQTVKHTEKDKLFAYTVDISLPRHHEVWEPHRIIGVEKKKYAKQIAYVKEFFNLI